MTSSPGVSWSISRNGWLWVTRWPAKTVLPGSPGNAVPGQWLGPLLMVLRAMPSQIECTRPILGISIVPIWMARSPGLPAGSTGWLGRGITTVVAVVLVVVGAGISSGGAAREILTRPRGVAADDIAARPTTRAPYTDITSDSP